MVAKLFAFDCPPPSEKWAASVLATAEWQRKRLMPPNVLHPNLLEVTLKKKLSLRIFQRYGLKLDKDLIFSGLAQNVYVYRMAKSKKIWPFRFYAIKFLSWEKMHGLLWQLRKMALKLLNYDWKRLIEIRWGSKKLFPAEIGVSETTLKSLTTIHRFVIFKNFENSHIL